MNRDKISRISVQPARLIYMAVFVGYPIVNNFILSFQSVNVMTFSQTSHPWVGWATYSTLFKDPLTITSMVNTSIFTVVCISFQFILGFVLAALFQLRFPGSRTIRGLLVITWMMPITITALVFKYMLSPGTALSIIPSFR